MFYQVRIKSKFLKLVAADAGKEFDELSHCGFGQDGSEDDVQKDFTSVRGLYDQNKFVKDINQQIEKLQAKIQKIQAQVK